MKTNPITQMFNNISDEEIRQGIKEIREDSETGIICEGVVRKYAAKMAEITSNDNVGMHLMAAEINILRQGAYRWLND